MLLHRSVWRNGAPWRRGGSVWHGFWPGTVNAAMARACAGETVPLEEMDSQLHILLKSNPDCMRSATALPGKHLLVGNAKLPGWPLHRMGGAMTLPRDPHLWGFMVAVDSRAVLTQHASYVGRAIVFLHPCRWESPFEHFPDSARLRRCQGSLPA